MSEMNSTVSVLPSAAAAEAVRGRLLAANIACTVVAADGAFRLQVADGDFTRAMQLLFPLPTAEQTAALTAPGGGPWKCSHCGEEVQPVSDVCWACGKPREGTPEASAPQVAAPPFVAPIAPPPMMPPSSSSGSSSPPIAPQSFASAPFASPSLYPAAIAAESFNAALPVPEAFDAAELARSAAAAPVAHDTPRAASSAASEAAETSATPTGAQPKQRSRRPVEIEEPNPWLEPRLLVLWALLGLAICVIIWLALR